MMAIDSWAIGRSHYSMTLSELFSRPWLHLPFVRDTEPVGAKDNTGWLSNALQSANSRFSPAGPLLDAADAVALLSSPSAATRIRIYARSQPLASMFVPLNGGEAREITRAEASRIEVAASDLTGFKNCFWTAPTIEAPTSALKVYLVALRTVVLCTGAEQCGGDCQWDVRSHNDEIDVRMTSRGAKAVVINIPVVPGLESVSDVAEEVDGALGTITGNRP
jgi:hypothetical protein